MDCFVRFSLHTRIIRRHCMHSLKRCCTSNAHQAHTGATSTWQRKIFSGIQPTGSLHLGNYFGAIKRWVDLQDRGENVIYSIVDLHSITLPQDPKELSKNILYCTATLLACGINPEKSILFLQSMVGHHAELSWVLGCLTTMPRLAHLPQYKEKSAELKDVPLGLYMYPVLQSADILLYKATHVPVGEDQVQHLQLAQHLANTFNNKFGKTFPHVKALIEENCTARLRSLRNPQKKMSKSDPDPRSRIDLTDEPEIIVEKCKKAVTDFTSQVTYDPEGRRGVATLIELMSLCTGKSYEDICAEYSNVDTGQFKLIVADALVHSLTPIRTQFKQLIAEPHYLHQILNSGAEQADIIANKTWQEVKQKVGLKPM